MELWIASADCARSSRQHQHAATRNDANQNQRPADPPDSLRCTDAARQQDAARLLVQSAVEWPRGRWAAVRLGVQTRDGNGYPKPEAGME